MTGDLRLQDRRVRASSLEGRALVDLHGRITEAAVLTPAVAGGPGIAVAARQQPCEALSPLSGDACDVLALDDTTWHLAVVDVTGHGVARTSRALSALHTLRELALADHPFEDLLDRALTLLHRQDPDWTAACVVGRFETRSGRLRLLGAGSPPVVLRRREGSSDVLELPGSPLGLGVGVSPRVVERQLADQDRALLFTDGVLGRGTVSEVVRSVERVHTRISGIGLEDVVSQVMGDLVPAVPEDDATLLGIERDPTQVASSTPARVFTARLIPRLADVAPTRVRLRRWLDARGVAATIADDLVLVVSELASNAVRMARGHVEVQVEHEVDERVVVAVRDDGPGLPPGAMAVLEAPHSTLDRTRGLFLVSALSDDVRVASDGSGTVIRSVRYLQRRSDSRGLRIE